VALLILILAVAAGFRIHGLNFDDGTHQHPDERFLTDVASRVAIPPSLGNYFSTQTSTLNPYARGFNNYAYGQLPLTLTRAVGEIVHQTSFDTINMVGRSLSVAADLGTIVFAWLLARRVFGVREAHLAGVLLAVTVLQIQLAHFFAVDTFVAFFCAGSLFFGQRAWQRESLLDATLAGAFAGFAMASKVSALVLLPVLLLAFLWPRSGRLSRDGVLDGATTFAVALLAAFVAFRITEPYAFVGPAIWDVRLNAQWVADKAYFAQISSGTIDVPYMIQWAGTPAYAFVVQAIVQWGMGPGLGLAGFLGLALCCWRFIRGFPLAREREALLLLAWVLLNLVYFGGQFAKFLRYLEPIYFGLAILAAYLLVYAVDWSRARGVLRYAVAGVGTVVVASTALWALAFSSIYDQPHSRIQATEWMDAHIPPGSALAVEHWDDRLPLPLPNLPDRHFRDHELKLYDSETPQKREDLLQSLDQSDYIVLASRRLIGSIPRLPERYPLATTYYRLLTSGQLGFQKVEEVQITPRLGPFVIDDSLAQEDFAVYDHPTVEIWQKQPNYSSADVHALLDAVPIQQAVDVRAINGGKGALLLTPAESVAAVAGGTWSQLFHRDDFANQFPLLVWLLTAELIAFAAVPLLWLSLRRLPDGGFGASKILGLALVSYVPWLLASLKIAPFGRPSLFLTWLGLLGISIGIVWWRRQPFLAWLRREWRLLLSVEAVFLVGFALWIWLRAVNPDLWHPAYGGEKPMNFAYLNAVVKSDYFPPYDPWFAGGIINYYYYGLVLVAALVKLTGILPQVAFNLAQPTIFGALCAGVFSLAFAIIMPVTRSWASRSLAYLAGAAAVVLTGLVGNLDAGLQLIDQLKAVGAPTVPGGNGLVQVWAGLLAVVAGANLHPLDFWHSTRFIGPEDPGPIHEFPYFTFLYGDMHAHELALPLTVAALLVAFNLVLTARAAPRACAWLALVWAGLVLGMLRATNTWDFPTYTAVVCFALVLGLGPAILRGNARAVQTLVVSLITVGILSQLLFWPYLQRYQLFYTGVDPVHARTALSQFLTIHGLLLFLGGSLLAWYLVGAQRRALATRRARTLVAEPGYYGVFLPVGTGWRLSSPSLWVALGLGAIGIAFAAAGYPTRGFLVVGIGFAGAALLGTWRRPGHAFQAGLFGAGLIATLIPEFVALQGDVGRMNTVFKFYLQAWVLLAVAGAAALAWLVQKAGRDPFLRLVRPAWIVAAVILFAAAIAYPLFASEGKLGLRFAPLPLGLDGMAYMDHATYLDRPPAKPDSAPQSDLNLPGDAEAIRWLQDNVQGSPTVLEGRSPVYRWGSRIAVYTGLPTVLGWDVHQGQQRTGYPSMLQQRANDVERAYSSTRPADAMEVIRTYAVRWVVIGGLERAYYPSAGLDKFASMPELRLAYDHDGVQIYEVVSSSG
jgi:YYY domain-containing protein